MSLIRQKQHWLLRTNHRMRAASFAMLFVATSLHVAGKGYGALSWVLFGMLFLVYPHFQYWRARKAKNAVVAEMNNLRVDSIVLGVAVAALAFPLWITFCAMIGTLTNNVVNKGPRGAWETIGAFGGGMLVGTVVAGFKFSPHTDWTGVFIGIGCLTWYLTVMANVGFTRNRELRLTRQKLQLGEAEMLKTNEALQQNLNDIVELEKRLREQVNRDPLTRLFNRRYVDATLERELARCKRERQPLCLIMIDIDHFKKINDTYGHHAGDEVLIRLSEILSELVRAGDVACRYGGEEFLLIMPVMSGHDAEERSQELRLAFEEMVVPFGHCRLRATLSIGISVYPIHSLSAYTLLECADRALYEAKQRGCNRVALYSSNSISYTI